MLYKYTAFRSEFFQNRMVRFAQPWYLNDPFEGQVNNDELLEYDKNSDWHIPILDGQIKEKGYEYHDIGVISLSKNRKSLLMWAHYADNHAGILICLDDKAPLFGGRCGKAVECICHQEDVEYDNTRMAVSARLDNSSYPPRAILRKSKEWKYEKEVRIYLNKKCAEPNKPSSIKVNMKKQNEELWLKSINKSKIMAIVIGVRADPVDALEYYLHGIIKGTISTNTKLYFSMLSSTKYSLEYVQFSNTEKMKDRFDFKRASMCFFARHHLEETYGVEEVSKMLKGKLSKSYYRTYELVTRD